MGDRGKVNYNWMCLSCGATYSGGSDRCTQCGGRLKRDDMVTDEDLEKIKEGR